MIRFLERLIGHAAEFLFALGQNEDRVAVELIILPFQCQLISDSDLIEYGFVRQMRCPRNERVKKMNTPLMFDPAVPD